MSLQHVFAQTSMTASAVGWPVVLASLTLVLVAMGLAWWLGLGIERDLIVASVRAAVQLLAVGVVFAFIFNASGAVYWAWVWVVFMVLVASRVVVRRARHRIDYLAVTATVAVAASALLSIGVSFGFDVIAYTPVSLVVVAGITIGNAVPSAVLGVNQAVILCQDRAGEIEAMMSLGLDRRQIVRLMAPRAAKSSVIPQVERTKVVGLIALPGAMTGLLLAGVEPLEAVAVQLLVMYLVLGTAALCVVATVASITRAAVTPDLRIAGWVRERDPE